MLSISILLYFLLRIFVFFPSWWLEAKTKSFSLTVVSQANIFQWMSLLCAHVTEFKGSCMNCTKSPHHSSPVWIKLISPILMLKKKKGFWEVWGLFWWSREQKNNNKKNMWHEDDKWCGMPWGGSVSTINTKPPTHPHLHPSKPAVAQDNCRTAAQNSKSKLAAANTQPGPDGMPAASRAGCVCVCRGASFKANSGTQLLSEGHLRYV